MAQRSKGHVHKLVAKGKEASLYHYSQQMMENICVSCTQISMNIHCIYAAVTKSLKSNAVMHTFIIESMRNLMSNDHTDSSVVQRSASTNIHKISKTFLMTGYIEFARLESSADAIHAVTFHPALAMAAQVHCQ